MNDNKISKYENPIRIAELNPKNTLIRAGFGEGMILCDLGAGTGIFSFLATQISNNDIYALELSDGMIDILKSRAIERKIDNLKILKVNSPILPLGNSICDMAIMVTVFHEIEDKNSILNEIKRILKDNGKLMIIEFHKNYKVILMWNSISKTTHNEPTGSPFSRTTCPK